MATSLALVGSINENILPYEGLAETLLSFLKANYKDNLIKRFKLDEVDSENEVVLAKIAKNRGLLTQGKIDIAKAQKLLLNEFKSGKIGRISLEQTPKCL